MEKELRERLFSLIRMSLWPERPLEAGLICDERLYGEMNAQALLALPAGILSHLNMSPEMRKRWQMVAYEQLYLSKVYCHIESTLPISVPYVILKGTSAAQYYPHPEYRTLGDIDIITARNDYDKACEELLTNGYNENTVVHPREEVRHRSFIKDNITIEIHASFDMMDHLETASYMDDLIRSHIGPTHHLPELINGLVILEHIRQHLETGVGLRQIIDWMMFVDKCLPDERWIEIEEMVKRVGLEKIAIVITHMCEMYLGLTKRHWAMGADLDLCEQLMNYVLSCGNFGRKLDKEEMTSIRVLSVARSPKAFFRFLVKHGVRRWSAAQYHSVLRPLAAFRLLGYYIRKGFDREKPMEKFKTDILNAKRKTALLEQLNVKTYI